MKRLFALALSLVLFLNALCGCAALEEIAGEILDYSFEEETAGAPEEKPAEDGVYTSRDEVALYLVTYGRLPQNFITKEEAQALGWPGGDLEPYAPGKCIGGDRFGNYEKRLPTDRSYRECDIDTLGKKSRGTKRLIWSDDGWIYYTSDHYETFTALYQNGVAL